MTDRLVISIDAMGGDHGPSVILPAVAASLKRLGDVGFILHGDPAVIAGVAKGALDPRITVRESQGVIASDAKPAHAMRRGKGTSMWNTVESVRSGEAHAAVSAGNTGALMAISRLLLRMVGGMERPALVANWPTSRGVSSVLDVGANINCDEDRLVDFAILGAAFHRAVHGTARPSVGLLNVGVESEKGHEEVKGADHLLRGQHHEFNYRGFVEGDDIAKGTVDVIVTDGFTGNVALKTAEGLARFFRDQLRSTLTASPSAKLGALIASGPLRAMAKRLDPSTVNGGPFLGLAGIVVKSHGGSDAPGMCNAINMAAELARGDFVRAIDRDLAKRSATAGAAA